MVKKLPLTEKEKKIAELVGTGLSNAEAAKVLGVAMQTVRNRLPGIYLKAGVKNRVQLAVWWSKQ